MEPVLLVERNKEGVSGLSSISMNPSLLKRRKLREQIGGHTVLESEVDRIYLKMAKNQIIQDAVDFDQIRRDAQRALRPKKPINNKHYKRQISKIKKSWK